MNNTGKQDQAYHRDVSEQILKVTGKINIKLDAVLADNAKLKVS